MKLNSKSRHYGVLASVGIGLLLLAAPEANAMVGHCANCHTMHASQDGAALNTPTAQLLNSATCTGCHTGNTNGVGFLDGPQVDGTTGNYLAGGTFAYVTPTVHNTGHNVDELNDPDDNMPNLAPPGDDGLYIPPSGTVAASWATQQLRCAGTNGCHGDRNIADPMASIAGAHHGNDDLETTGGTTATVGESFRFLQGISGYEDPEWELNATASLHNQYKGVDRGDDDTVESDTISALCAQCHGIFHNTGTNVSLSGNMDNPWVRHPTDFDMGSVRSPGDGLDYDGYGGVGTNAYQLEAPVASVDVSTPIGAVYASTGDAIVTCVSCHRAHGSEYADALRWDYDQNLVGSTIVADGIAGNGTGCLLCHTTK